MDDVGGIMALDQEWNLFSGMGGVPFRTKKESPPLIKNDDPEHMQPQLSHDIKVRVFDMSKEDDIKEYTEILNFCARKLGRILEKEIEYVRETNNWKILLSWAAYFWEDPSESSTQCKKYYNNGE